MKNPIIKGVLLAVFAVAAFYSAVIGLLQFSLFDRHHDEKGLEQYLSEGPAFEYMQGRIEIELPAEVVATEVERTVAGSSLHSSADASRWHLDPAAGRLASNASIHGFFIPLSVEALPRVEEGAVVLDWQDLRLGSWGWPSFGFWGGMAEKRILEPAFPLVHDRKAVDPYGMLVPVEARWSETGMKVLLEPDYNGIRRLLKALRLHVSDDLAQAFSISEDGRKQQAAMWMTQTWPLTDDEVGVLLEDAFSDQTVLRYMLLLLEPAKAEEALALLPLVLHGVSVDTLDGMRYDLYAEAVESYSQLLIELYESYVAEGRILVSGGRAYSPEKGGTLAFSEAAAMEGIELPEAIADKLSAAFSPEDGSVRAVYQVDAASFLVFSKDGREEMDLAALEEAYPKRLPRPVTRRIGKAAWETFEKTFKDYFETDEVFIRYLSSDDWQAFAIVSPGDDYQNYWVMALEQTADGSGWRILDDNVESLAALARNFPGFNLDLATDEFQRVSVFELQEAEIRLILMQMADKGYIKEGGSTEMAYCSFDGTYIAFKLTNGGEYVYKVEEMYLAILLFKETAMDRWPDVPDMLLLDEPEAFL